MKDIAVLDMLMQKNVIPSNGIFEVTNDMLDAYYTEYNLLYSGTQIPNKPTNIRYARKLAALSMLKLNDARRTIIASAKKSKTNIRSGFVYVISNPAFPNHYKIGVTRDVLKRLAAYQTYAPMRDFCIEHYIFHEDIRQEEKRIINKHKIDIVKGEWIPVTQYHEIFEDLK